MKKLAALLAGTMLMMGLTTVAGAYSITAADLTQGAHSVTNTTNGWTAGAWGPSDQATPGYFDGKTVNGLYGVGIRGGTGGEIDTNEYLRFDFQAAQQINSITLGFLYATPAFGDPNEIARIFASGAAYAQVADLTAGPSSGAWVKMIFDPSISSVKFWGTDASSTSDQGKWTVYNPFGDNYIKSLVFTSLHASGPTSNDSDYAFVDMSTVPEPGTMVLLGFGMLGLAIYGKRRMNREA